MIILNDYNLIESQIFLLINNEKIYNNIIPFINNNIIEVNLLFKLFIFFSHIKEKDLFIKQYHNELIKRLLSNKTKILIEISLLSYMKKVFGEKEIIKLSKCIYDYELSIKNTVDFFSNDIHKNTIITTSYDSWNIDYNNGYLDYLYSKNNDIGFLNFINQYNIFYKKKVNKNKKLVWLLHFGEIIINYNNYEIKLFPIQLVILELFNFSESYLLDDIKNNNLFKNYQSDYIDNIIKSLEISGILRNKDNILFLSDIVFETNLIQLYYNCSTNIVTINDINSRLNEELAHSRKEIICTLINHLLKKGNKNYNELFESVKSIENTEFFALSKFWAIS
jgi:hypothetical protein